MRSCNSNDSDSYEVFSKHKYVKQGWLSFSEWEEVNSAIGDMQAELKAAR